MISRVSRNVRECQATSVAWCSLARIAAEYIFRNGSSCEVQRFREKRAEHKELAVRGQERLFERRQGVWRMFDTAKRIEGDPGEKDNAFGHIALRDAAGPCLLEWYFSFLFCIATLHRVRMYF